jgi:glycosyltransferase involved in cell wall biosynthesis
MKRDQKIISDQRLLAIAPHFIQGFGGIPESVLILAHYLRGLGIETDLLCFEGFFRSMGALQGLPSSRSAFKDPSAMRFADYAVVFVAGSWNPLAAKIAIRAAVRRTPLVYSPKGNLCSIEFTRLRDLKKLPYFMFIEVFILWAAKAIILSSQIERNAIWFPARLFSSKVTVIPELFREPSLGSHERTRCSRRDRLVFGFLAEIAPRKGLEELVDGFVRWQERAIRSDELHIVGEPRPGSEHYEKRIRMRARKSRRDNAIIWHGSLRGDSRNRFYESLDFFVCSSRFESFGLTVLEALWHGTPVITAPNVGVLEQLPENAPVIRMAGLSNEDIQTAFEFASMNCSRFAEEASRFRKTAVPWLGAVDQFKRVLFYH